MQPGMLNYVSRISTLVEADKILDHEYLGPEGLRLLESSERSEKKRYLKDSRDTILLLLGYLRLCFICTTDKIQKRDK